MASLDHIRTPSTRTSVLASLLVAVALVCGPLAFAPAQAATVSVSGLVVDSSGEPVQRAWVEVWSRNAEDETYYYEDDLAVSTDATGHYALDLEPGTYKISFTGDDQYVSEYYDDKATLKTATPIVVGDDAVTLEDAELALLPSVTGTVKAENGSAVPWGYAVAFRDDPQYGWDVAGYTDIDTDGGYALPLGAGTYRIGFFDEDDSFVPEFWDNAPTIDQGRDVVVGADDVSGVDAVLAPAPVRHPNFTNDRWPTIGSYLAVGAVVRSTDGRWSPAPSSFARQWLRNGVPIAGATGRDYRITPADAGARLSIRVTASGPSYAPTTAVSGSGMPVKWTSKIAVSSKPGRKKATIKIRVSSAGGHPTGKVVIKQRFKLIKVVWLRKGKASVTLKKLKKKQRYTFHYYGSAATYPSAVNMSIKTK